VTKTPWKQEELNAVKAHFAKDIALRKLPGKLPISKFLELQTVANRPWTLIKFKIRDIINSSV